MDENEYFLHRIESLVSSLNEKMVDFARELVQTMIEDKQYQKLKNLDADISAEWRRTEKFREMKIPTLILNSGTKLFHVSDVMFSADKLPSENIGYFLPISNLDTAVMYIMLWKQNIYQSVDDTRFYVNEFITEQDLPLVRCDPSFNLVDLDVLLSLRYEKYSRSLDDEGAGDNTESIRFCIAAGISEGGDLIGDLPTFTIEEIPIGVSSMHKLKFISARTVAEVLREKDDQQAK